MGGNPFSRLGRLRLGRRKNSDGTMTLIEHLYELRYRLGIALLWVLAGSIFGFLWFDMKIGPVDNLGDLLKQPYCDIPANLRATLGQNGGCALLSTDPFGAFGLRFKVGLTAGIVFTSPAWLYQLWAFITPGLYAKERKFAVTFVAVGGLLFIGGAALAYIVVLHKGLEVLASMGGGQVVTALTGTSYFSFVISLLVIFGASFELPLIIIMLNRVGMLPYEKLKKWRRGIIFALFVFAAVATPSPDAVTMSILAVALTILAEFAIQITRLHDRGLARQRAAEGWDSWSDEEQSPLNHQVEPVGEVEPVEPSSIPAPSSSRARYDDAT